MQKILGLDISTSITGATIVESGKITESKFWDTRNKRKFPTLYEKADFLQENLWEIKSKHDISHIYIEQSLQSFRSGFSSAKTLSTLSRLNGIISFCCYKAFDIKPEMLAASSARKTAGLEIKRGENSKEKVFNYQVEVLDSAENSIDFSAQTSSVKLDAEGKQESILLSWKFDVPWSNNSIQPI